MPRTTLRLAAAVIALVAVAPAGARAATLRASDGSRLTVSRVRASEAGLVRAWDGAGLLRYEVVDADGRSWAGSVPGCLPGELAPTLAQNPLTGEVLLAYSALAGADGDLVLHSWTGQQWTEPLWLTQDDAPDVRPSLAFDGEGDAVLAWLRDGRLLVRHARLGGVGETLVTSFSDLGDPPLFGAGGDVRLPAGVAQVATDAATREAFVVLADPDRDEVGVARLDLAVLGDIWGGSAAPVPVTFALDGAPVAQGTKGSTSLDLVGGHDVAATLVAPFRVELHGAEALYWFDPAHVRAIAFRNGEALPLLTLERPDSDSAAHFTAFAALRQQLLRGSCPAPRARPASVTRR